MQTLFSWLGYNFVLGALLPITLVGSFLWLSKVQVSLTKLIRDGQLFLYTALLAASAIGDLMKEAPSSSNAISYQPIWLFALVICIIFASFLFGVAAYARDIDDRRLATMSWCFTLGATIMVAAMRWTLNLL